MCIHDLLSRIQGNTHSWNKIHLCTIYNHGHTTEALFRQWNVFWSTDHPETLPRHCSKRQSNVMLHSTHSGLRAFGAPHHISLGLSVCRPALTPHPEDSCTRLVILGIYVHFLGPCRTTAFNDYNLTYVLSPKALPLPLYSSLMDPVLIWFSQ